MATYLELKELLSDSNLQDKVEIAISKKAQTIIENALSTQAEKDWAVSVNPIVDRDRFLRSVLMANSELTVAQIQGASDAAIQSNIDAVIDVQNGV